MSNILLEYSVLKRQRTPNVYTELKLDILYLNYMWKGTAESRQSSAEARGLNTLGYKQKKKISQNILKAKIFHVVVLSSLQFAGLLIFFAVYLSSTVQYNCSNYASIQPSIHSPIHLSISCLCPNCEQCTGCHNVWMEVGARQLTENGDIKIVCVGGVLNCS